MYLCRFRATSRDGTVPLIGKYTSIITTIIVTVSLKELYCVHSVVFFGPILQCSGSVRIVLQLSKMTEA